MRLHVANLSQLWRPAILIAVGITLLSVGCRPLEDVASISDGIAERFDFDVHPGDDIQVVLDEAAKVLRREPSARVTVLIHEGTYRPLRQGQALIHLNRRHDGITLQGIGQVTLTAANEAVADRADASFPAIVNHVVFFGDGISARTVLRGVTITGANGFVGDDDSTAAIELDSDIPQLAKSLFYYVDGGAIKIFGRSYPTIDQVTIEKNATRLCGAGVSVEHRGFLDQAAVFTNCVFPDNRCPGTGSAIDVLGGSAAFIENCLFVRNIANTGMDRIAAEFGLRYNPEHGCGALTVFPESRVTVRRCTFTSNWNGADDKGPGNTYLDSIFWQNTASDGSLPGEPYEMDIIDASNVRGCRLGGVLMDLRGTIDSAKNILNASDPEFDASFQPLNDEYRGIGYRSMRAVEPLSSPKVERHEP